MSIYPGRAGLFRSRYARFQLAAMVSGLGVSGPGGTLALSGASQKSTSRGLTAAAAFVGDAQRMISRAFAAVVDLAGAVRGFIAGKMMAGELAFSAVMRAFVSAKALTAALSFIGEAGAFISAKALAATLSFIAGLDTIAGRVAAFTAALAFSAADSRVVYRNLLAGFMASGTVVKQTARLQGGIAAFIGAVAKQTARLQVGTTAFIGAVSRMVGRVMTAGLAAAGAVSRQVSRAWGAVLTWVTDLTPPHRLFQSLLAALGFSSTRGHEKIGQDFVVERRSTTWNDND